MFEKKDLRILFVFLTIACAAAAVAYWLANAAQPTPVTHVSPSPPTEPSPVPQAATLAPTQAQGAVETQVASGVAATLTARLTATVPPPAATAPPSPATDTPVPSQPTKTAIPTRIPTFPTIPASYLLVQEQAIGAYTFRLWADMAAESFDWDQIATLSTGGRVVAQHGLVYEVGRPLGTDITGEGNPDVIIHTFTGGAHCCFSTIVYDLGPSLTKVLETPLSNCTGGFEDLDGDSVMEFVTCDDLLAYVYCAFAGSPLVRVVLQYEPGQGYVPASPRFPETYAEDLARHREWAQNLEPGVEEEYGMTKCSVLWLVLDYLYMGDPEQAWLALDRYYPHPGKNLFWAEVVRAVSSSPLYTPGGPLPDVPQPDYYMLQLLTSCDPEWQWIGLLQEGQDPCAPEVPTWGTTWLEIELTNLGLMPENASLEVAPEGCTTNCRLDIVRWSDGKHMGSIRLDTTVGFPGAVYRTNGQESIRYRLRGDLTWEPVQ